MSVNADASSAWQTLWGSTGNYFVKDGGVTAIRNQKLQRHQSIQGWSKVIAASHRFGETQHRVALTVCIAKHAQQLLLNVVQTGAVGAGGYAAIFHKIVTC